MEAGNYRATSRINNGSFHTGSQDEVDYTKLGH